MHVRWLVSFSIVFGSGFAFACSGDDGNTSTQADTMVGDGDGDETTNTGDGDGDGDTGDGDGDTGDGDGDPTETGDGDGDGDPTEGCTPGELGCDCNNGLCLGDLECVGGTCTDPQCIPGELACQCNNGQCLGDLECNDGVCEEPEPDPCGNGLTLCDGQCVDTQTDDLNCGSCGNECLVRDEFGHCEAGECTPTLSECQATADGVVPCATLCQAEGLTCAANQCDTATIFWVNDPVSCEEFALGGGFSGTCQEPMVAGNNHYRCCCAQQ